MFLLGVLSLTTALIQAPPAIGTASISGRVAETGSGAPIPDAQVTILPIPVRNAPFTGIPEPPLSVRTDKDGRFTIRELAPGRYRLAAQKSGYAMAFGPGAASTIELASGQEHSADLTLERGAAIVGRVVNDAGEPLVNLRVMALRNAPVGPRSATGNNLGLIPAGPTAQTNDLGEFRLFSLPAGEYYVQASPVPHFGRATQQTRTLVATFFPDATESSLAQTITVGAGQTTDSIVIRMTDAPAFQVSGIVVDGDGRPVANAMVRLDPPRDGRPHFTFGPSLQARTNSTGAFSLSNVTSATYTLVAIAPVLSNDSRGASGNVGTGIGVGASQIGWAGTSIVTESRNGVTIQYRGDLATEVQISVNQGDLSGIQVAVRLPR
jgi:hypothetical protein